MRPLFVAFALASTPWILPPALAAQDPELSPPPTWKVRLDSPDRGSVEDIWYVDQDGRSRGPRGARQTEAVLWGSVRCRGGNGRVGKREGGGGRAWPGRRASGALAGAPPAKRAWSWVSTRIGSGRSGRLGRVRARWHRTRGSGPSRPGP
jgi:hypothetical protein